MSDQPILDWPDKPGRWWVSHPDGDVYVTYADLIGKDMAWKHAGEIWVYSDELEGSCYDCSCETPDFRHRLDYEGRHGKSKFAELIEQPPF